MHLPILVVDFNAAAANHIAEQLRHGGLQVDIATNGAAAHAAACVRRYGSVIVVADLSQTVDLECLGLARIGEVS